MMTLRTILRTGAVLLVLAATAAAPARAQNDEKPKNLKVLPADIGKRDLDGIMHGWSDALGVRCTFCHEQKVPGDFRSIDFASDALAHKETARRMFTMVRDLNGGALPKAAGEDDAAVSCVTCHRGLTNPATLDAVVLTTVRKDGIDAAVAKYRELREKYYGSGSYDFGEDSLDPAINALAGDPEGLDAAAALVALDVEMFPADAETRVKQAQVLMLKGDKAGAGAALAEALKLDPENRHAKRMQQQLGQ
ncbi:MAG TPA: c-type cytochrome [Candidatus Krumholzibacteria bacterium]|nr:c-type cytochrome [Candidatus Krumholzibacteria bacterium]